MTYLLYRTALGPVATSERGWLRPEQDWDELLADDELFATLEGCEAVSEADEAVVRAIAAPLSPVSRQEVWAAGVTYLRSREARREESRASGGQGFYDHVYDAPRPELFLKATPARVVAPGATLRLRGDSRWMVPEPELALLVSPAGHITGYTVGNDLSCRDIEGENPLYLPQAKTFDGCAALGPALLVTNSPPPPETRIQLDIERNGESLLREETTLSRMKRTLEELVEYLYRELSHPAGCFLMTGTGIVPPDDFSLRAGDGISITIDGIGTLRNPVA